MKAAACLFVLLLPVVASADSITYSAAFGNRLPLPELSGFDLSLGELYRVDLAVSGGESGFWRTTDDSLVSSGVFNFSFEMLIGGGFVGGVIANTPFALDSPSQAFPWGGSFEMTSTLTDDMGMFCEGSVTPYFFCNAWFTPTPMVGSLSDVSGVESVTYTFGPAVPEPASWLMLLIGAAVVAVATERKGT